MKHKIKINPACELCRNLVPITNYCRSNNEIIDDPAKFKCHKFDYKYIINFGGKK